MKRRKKFKNLKVKDIRNICNSYDDCGKCPLHYFNCMGVQEYKLDEVVEYEIKTNKCK